VRIATTIAGAGALEVAKSAMRTVES